MSIRSYDTRDTMRHPTRHSANIHTDWTDQPTLGAAAALRARDRAAGQPAGNYGAPFLEGSDRELEGILR